jgi:adenosylmethionine-8-amino-7-oxononanoate aminotransferase
MSKIFKESLIWRPFTQEKITDLSIKITKGEGAYLYDEKNNQYLDLISSWWVNLHGHGNKKIAEAIYDQAKKLEHVIFAGFTHDPAEDLCQKLCETINKPKHSVEWYGFEGLMTDSRSPNIKMDESKPLNKFFFSDNGSTAVEVALKVAYQFHKNDGKNKKIFLSLRGDYHGDTFGAMSASKTSGYHKVFEDFFIEFEFIEVPYIENNIYESDDENKNEFHHAYLMDVERREENILTKLEIFLKNNSDNIAGFICEPIVQGASGMKIYRKEFLNKLVFLLREYNILIILDEVMTGFGRTGKNFAFHHCNFIPDMICLSKGLTGGFLPMGLTVFTSEIYNKFLGDNYSKAFLHGHSYTANPLGCAAAIASLNLLEEKETQNNIKNINKIHHEELRKLENNYVKNKGIIGTISVITTYNFSDCLKAIVKSNIEGHTNARLNELNQMIELKNMSLEKIVNKITRILSLERNNDDIDDKIGENRSNLEKKLEQRAEWIDRFLRKKLSCEIMKNGLVIRPIGNNIYLIPPYCIEEKDLRNSYKLINKIVTKVYEEFIIEFFKSYFDENDEYGFPII